MPPAAASTSPLALYRALLRAGRAYPDYNIRHYIIRRARDSFRANRAAAGADATRLLQEGASSLALIGRQSTIAGFYAPAEERSVMEQWEERQQQSKGGASAGRS